MTDMVDAVRGYELSDRYRKDNGRVFLSGAQALVDRDREHGMGADFEVGRDPLVRQALDRRSEADRPADVLPPVRGSQVCAGVPRSGDDRDEGDLGIARAHGLQRREQLFLKRVHLRAVVRHVDG